MQHIPKLHAAELEGIEAYCVEVEADLNVGLHAFNIVGLADKAVSEAKERVNSALKNCGIKPPTRENRRITINLAPADMKKAGSRFDLPIALAYLLASDQIKPFATEKTFFIGELSLDGTLRPVNGCLNIALLAQKIGFTTCVIPKDNAEEAAVLHNITIIPVRHLKDLIAHCEGNVRIHPQPLTPLAPTYEESLISLDDVRGNTAAKRALTVAATGNHNILFSGPPGTGKTMLAQSLLSILPPPSAEECIEITQIHSAAQTHITHSSFIHTRQFRAPHHSASLVSLMGGGSNPKPGEVSLAHRGVLFLDEFPEFHRDALEALRQPLEEGHIHVARAKKALIFPARFMLVAAMNPCPCGHFEDPDIECRCTAHEILRYQKKISGPLLDRIDIHIEIPRISLEELRMSSHIPSLTPPRVTLQETRNMIFQAVKLQRERFSHFSPKIYRNAEMSAKQVDACITLHNDAEQFLKRVLERAFLSPRGYYRILKVARTIADLAASPIVTQEHLAEAFQYRIKTGVA